jgi:hypothetical protein
MNAASFVWRWRIVEMELWDQEFVDLESPGHITFDRGGRGELHFGAVDVTLDWRVSAAHGFPPVASMTPWQMRPALNRWSAKSPW